MSAWHSARVRAWDGDSVALPKSEAKHLYALLRTETAETIRALIGVSDSDMTQLLKHRSVEQVSQIVSYRKQVREFFDALVEASAPIALPPEITPRRKPRKGVRGKRGNGRPRKLSYEQINRMRLMFQSGSMKSEIGRRFAVSGTTVARTLALAEQNANL